MQTENKTVKKKSLPHYGKKLPFGIFSFRVCVSKDRSMTEEDGNVCAEFRCQGAYRRKAIINHFAETLLDFVVQHSTDGIHFGAAERNV
jgi:hypothetical protein